MKVSLFVFAGPAISEIPQEAPFRGLVIAENPGNKLITVAEAEVAK